MYKPGSPDPNYPWDLECLLCRELADNIVPVSVNGVENPLIRMQEHAMEAHDFTQEEFPQHYSRIDEGRSIIHRADGTDWLKFNLRGRTMLKITGVSVEIHHIDGRDYITEFKNGRWWTGSTKFLLAIQKLNRAYLYDFPAPPLGRNRW